LNPRSILALIFTCTIALTACTYQDEPDRTIVEVVASAAPILPVTAPAESTDMLASHLYGRTIQGTPLPTAGPCSYSEAEKLPIANLALSDSANSSLLLLFATPTIHIERGLTVSLPRSVYEKVQHEGPNGLAASGSLIPVSQATIEGLMSRNERLRALIQTFNSRAFFQEFFLTSYQCLPVKGRQ
jgi:hypothetical protein